MKYDLKNKKSVVEAFSYLSLCVEQGKTVEIKIRRPKRSLAQNAYLHVCLSVLALETGCSIDYAKDILKRYIAPHVFLVVIQDFEVARSSTDLDSKEISVVIDMLRDHLVKFHNAYVPSPDEQAAILAIENEVEAQQKYLTLSPLKQERFLPNARSQCPHVSGHQTCPA